MQATTDSVLNLLKRTRLFLILATISLCLSSIALAAELEPANYGIDFYGDLLYSSEKYVSKNPDRAIAFKDASLKGWDYALANPE